LEGLLPTARDDAALLALFERYGFRSWLRDLTGDDDRIPKGDARVRVQAAQRDEEAGVPVAPAAELGPVKYDTVSTWEAFDEWMQRIQAAELVAIDTETCGGFGARQPRLVGISLCVEPGSACYIPLAHRHPDLDPGAQLPMADVLSRMKPWLEDPAAAKVLHHAKFDTHAFANSGIALQGVAHDTMLQAYVLESHRGVSMQDLAQRWLGRTGVTYESLCGKGVNQIGFDEVSLDVASFYAAEDADFTLQLHRVLYPQVQADERLLRTYQLEIPVSRVLAVIERNGVRIDAAELNRQSQALGRTMLTLEQKAYELAGQPFNLNSPKQLGEILFGRMGLPVVRKTASGAPSTDEEVLSRLAQDYPLPKVLLEYRGLAKLKSTYTDKLPRMVDTSTGRVHTSYAQAAVITGRLASSDPNLQNIPVRTAEGRRVREAFVAGEGRHIVSADYSQIELRVMAHVADDESLQAAFKRGDDIHRATAAEVFGVAADAVSSDQRRAAKAINFGLIYGMSAFGLAANLGITREAAQVYMNRYFARYPGVARYMEETRQSARDKGYVETVFGRRLWLPEIRGGSGPRRAAAERAAINAPMQGTAADLIKLAMVAVQEWLESEKLESLLVMQVHDELVLEVPETELERVRESLPGLMCNVAQLKVPLVAEVGVGPTWEKAH
nr:DNA polymerase I [Pseudomonas sp.]